MLLPTFTFRILMSLKQFWGCGDFALYDLIILGGPKCQFCTFWRRRQVWNRILFTLSSFSQFAFWSMFAKLVELVPTEIHWLLFLSRVFTQNQQFKMSSSVVSQTKQNLLMPLTTFWVVVAFAAADCFTSFFVVKDIINKRTARCLKITEKVSFKIASEASYVYILIKNPQKWSILAHFW